MRRRSITISNETSLIKKLSKLPPISGVLPNCTQYLHSSNDTLILKWRPDKSLQGDLQDPTDILIYFNPDTLWEDLYSNFCRMNPMDNKSLPSLADLAIGISWGYVCLTHTYSENLAGMKLLRDGIINAFEKILNQEIDNDPALDYYDEIYKSRRLILEPPNENYTYSTPGTLSYDLYQLIIQSSNKENL